MQGIARVLVGMEKPGELWAYAALPEKLPPGTYKLEDTEHGSSAVLGWILGEHTPELVLTRGLNAIWHTSSTLKVRVFSEQPIYCRLLHI